MLGLSSKREGDLSVSVGKMLAENNLRHLDLSFNQISLVEGIYMAEVIKKNHFLWGIHMEGNACYVDVDGFIKPPL